MSFSRSADIVIIQYTANNFLTGADYEGTLEANIETIRKEGTQVFLLNYPVYPGSKTEDKFSQANNYIASTAKSMDVSLIDLAAYFSSLSEEEQKGLFSDDAIHLTAEGYTIMGDQIADFLHTYYYEMD